MNIYLIFGILCIASPFLYLYAKVVIKNSSPYKSKSLLTDNELEFFWRLTKALPDVFVFPQVAMSALIEPTAAENSKSRLVMFNQIAQKRVDYALFDTSMKLLCVVELDDKTHDEAKDKARDKLFNAAKVRTIRWNSKNKPGIAEIKMEVFHPDREDDQTGTTGSTSNSDYGLSQAKVLNIRNDAIYQQSRPINNYLVKAFLLMILAIMVLVGQNLITGLDCHCGALQTVIGAAIPKLQLVLKGIAAYLFVLAIWQVVRHSSLTKTNK